MIRCRGLAGRGALNSRMICFGGGTSETFDSWIGACIDPLETRTGAGGGGGAFLRSMLSAMRGGMGATRGVDSDEGSGCTSQNIAYIKLAPRPVAATRYPKSPVTIFMMISPGLRNARKW